MKWVDELNAIKTVKYKSVYREELNLDGPGPFFIPISIRQRDRLLAIVEGAVYTGLPNGLMGDFCTICMAEKGKPHDTTCPWSDEWRKE